MHEVILLELLYPIHTLRSHSSELTFESIHVSGLMALIRKLLNGLNHFSVH